MKSEDDNLLPSTEQKRTLKFYKKLAYGYGEFGIYIISAIQGFYLQQFLLEVAQIGAFEVYIFLCFFCNLKKIYFFLTPFLFPIF